MKRAVLLAVGLLAGCSASLDPGTLSCRNDLECPTGSYCTSSGKCALTPSDCPPPSVKVNDACKNPPATPVNARAVAGAIVSLAWDAANDATSWIVRRGVTAGTGPFPDQFTAATNSYTDSAVAPGTVYFYQVIAVNGAGQGSPTAALRALTLPGAVSVTVSGGANLVDVTWTAAPSATSYTVLHGAPGDSLTAAATGVAGLQYSDTGIASGTSMNYAVQAVNETGAGPAGTPVSALTLSDAPANVQATLAASKTQVQLTWDRSVGATSYQVERGAASGAETLHATVPDPGAGTQVTYTDTAPDSGLLDFYGVRAVNASGPSAAPSAEQSIQTVPAAPAAVTAQTVGTGASVSWTSSQGATGYLVLRDGINISGTLPTTPPLTFSDAPPAGGTYQYQVEALNAAGSGPASTGHSTTTPPSAPTLSIGTLTSSGTSTQVGLSWTRPSGATSYDVYRGPDPASEIVIQQDLPDPGSGASVTYADPETATGVSLSFHVVAKNAAPTGTGSNEIATTTVPSIPTGLAVVSQGVTSVFLSWTTVSSATSYTLFRAAGAGSPSAIATVNPSAGGTVSYQDDTAVPSTIYAYSVSASNDSGVLTSDASAPVTATTLTPTPAGVTAVPTDDTHVTVTWDRASSGVDSYDVTRGGTVVASVPDPGTGAQVIFPDSGLTANTSYTYTVTALHAASPTQSSNPSIPASALTMLPAPSGLSLSAATDQGITLTWTDPPNNPYQWDILRGLASGQEAIAFNDVFSIGGSPFTDFQLVPGVTYFYEVRLRDFNNGNVSLPTNEASLATTNVNGPVLAVADLDTTHVNLTLDVLPGYDVYQYFRSTSSTPAPSPLTVPSGSITQVTGLPQILATDTVPTNGTTWFYWARAKFSGGAQITAWSPTSVSTFVPNAPPPVPTPTNLAVLAAGGNEALVSWSPSISATSYTLTRTGASGATFTNIPNPYFTDATVANSQSYQYTVKAVGPGGTSVASTATPNFTVDPNAFTCTKFLTSYSDAPTLNRPVTASPLIWVPGSTTAITTKSLSDGHCLAVGVPAAGPIFIQQGQNYIQINNRTLDLSTESYGRADSEAYQTTTPVSFTIDSMMPWTSDSLLELTSSNVGASTNLNNTGLSASLDQVAFANRPSPGDTRISLLTADGEDWSGVTDTAKGDKTIVTQLSPQVSSNGIPYLTVSRTYAVPSWSQAQGRALALASGSFTDVITGASQQPFKYLRSQFKAFAAQVNPVAVNVSVPDSFQFAALPFDHDGVAHPLAGGGTGTDLLLMSVAAGTGDVDFGNILVPNAFPGWYTDAVFAEVLNVNVNCGASLPPYTYVTGPETIDSLAHVLPEAASPGLAPHMLPVGSPLIQGKSAFQDQTGMSLTPTLSWTAPTGIIQPNYYRLFLYQLADDGTGQCTGNLIGQLYTAGTSVTVPANPGLLASGGRYFIAIRPTYEPERNMFVTPFHRGAREYFVETVTNMFTP